MGLSKSARPDQWDTPAFKAWFAGSKVVDAQGNPQRVYHGTTQTFDKFDLSMGDSKGYYGAGFYFTSSDTDASVNYAGDAGPDILSKIEERVLQRLKEALPEGWTNGGFTPPNTPECKKLEAEFREQARQELTGGQGGSLYATYLRIEKPVTVSSDRISVCDRSGAYTPRTYAAFLKAGEGLAPRDQLEAVYKQCSSHFFENYNPSPIAATFEEEVRAGLYGRGVDPGEIIGRFYRTLGFDGVIQDASRTFTGMSNIGSGTLHYVVWKPTQVKSAITNTGAFSPRNPKLTAAFKSAYTPLKYDPKEYNSLKKVWGDQVINELIAAGKPWDNPIVMKRELEQNFLGTFHSIEEAMANLFDEQLGTPFIKKFRRPGTSEVDWTAVASKVVSPAHGLPGLFVVSIPGAAGDVHVFVRDSRKKKANFWDDEPQAVDPENPTPEEEAAWEEWAANRNEYVLHHQAADEAGKEPLDYLDDIVTLVTKNVARYRTTFKKPLGYKEVEKDLVEKLGMDEALASLVSPVVNQRVDTTIDPTMFKNNLKKVLTSPKAKNAAAMDYMLDSTQVPQQDPRADKTWDSPYCNNHGNERPTRDAESTTTTAAIEQHKEPKKLPPRNDMRTHLDKEVRDEIADDKAEAKEGSQNTKTQLPTPHVGAGVPTSRLLRRR